jgi:hypothetical protein
MKVMCVESPLAWLIVAGIYGGKIPEVGDECTVKAQRPCACGNHDVYDFEEFHLPTGFQVDCFAILPEADADDINATEQEAIVPNPIVESDPLSVEEKAIARYYQVLELTNCEQRAVAAYYEVLNMQP